MPHKLVILISALISIALFVTSFFWFSIWGYGLLCFCLISAQAEITVHGFLGKC